MAKDSTKKDAAKKSPLGFSANDISERTFLVVFHHINCGKSSSPHSHSQGPSHSHSHSHSHSISHGHSRSQSSNDTINSSSVKFDVESARETETGPSLRFTKSISRCSRAKAVPILPATGGPTSISIHDQILGHIRQHAATCQVFSRYADANGQYHKPIKAKSAKIAWKGVQFHGVDLLKMSNDEADEQLKFIMRRGYWDSIDVEFAHVDAPEN